MPATAPPNQFSSKQLKPAPALGKGTPPRRGLWLLASIVILMLVMAASLMLGAKAIPFQWSGKVYWANTAMLTAF